MPAPFVLSSDLVSAYPAKSVTLADYIDTSLAAKTDTAMVQNAQTGSSYSYALADASKLLTMSNASANTVLVTKQATVTWVTGTQLRVMNLGAGVTTLVADTGVTINGNVALKQYQGGTLIRTASDVWLFVPTSSSGGMDLITPTSVAGSGVTLSGGAVSFSAATAASVNGCFTAAYDVYKIVGNISAASVAGNAYVRMRAAGTDNSSANYAHNGPQVENSSATTLVTARTAGYLSNGFILAYNMNPGGFDMTLYAPFLAQKTMYTAMAVAFGATDMFLNTVAGNMNVTTSYDGMTVYPGGGGTLTGTLRIYGLRNS